MVASPGSALATENGSQSCVAWRDFRSEGGGNGEICNGSLATGTIWDNKADGRCPFIRFWYASPGTGNKYKNSETVGPAGTSKTIRVEAEPGKYFNGEATAEWRSC